MIIDYHFLLTYAEVFEILERYREDTYRDRWEDNSHEFNIVLNTTWYKKLNITTEDFMISQGHIDYCPKGNVEMYWFEFKSITEYGDGFIRRLVDKTYAQQQERMS